MTIGYRNLQFLDHNGSRKYPLKGDVTGTDSTATFTIPNDLIVGLQFSIDFALNVDPTKFYIKTLASFASGLQITIGYNAESGAVSAGTALISKDAHDKYDSYAITGLGDFADCLGTIVIGSLDNLETEASGEFNFDY